MICRRKNAAFTLAELLIALAILGVIATFSIPKVLQAQQNGASKAIAKEAAGAVSSAYTLYKLHNATTGNESFADLTPYLNYVKTDTTTNIDQGPGSTFYSCGGGVCLQLHNGAYLFYGADTYTFGGTGSTNALLFYIDPDGKYSGSAVDGPSKSVQFWLYYDGKVRTRSSLQPNTYCGNCPGNPYNPLNNDPSWFSWD